MARFKTGYLQRMIPIDGVVVGTVTADPVTATNRQAAILRGDFVVVTPATVTVPAIIQKATQAQVNNRTATHFVALTDMTIAGGKVPTDLKDYRPSNLVAAQVATAPTNFATPNKKVGLYPIWDWNDIVQDADMMDSAG